MKSSSTSSGFTLVELAVVLGVIALVAGSGLAFSVKQLEIQRVRDTRDKMQYILQAVDNFVDQSDVGEKYIPCPANGNALFTAADFGIGVHTPAGSDPATAVTTCNGLNVIDTGAENVQIGVVPTYTLNIAPEYVFDAWNRRFTYVVDQELTNGPDYNANDGEIQVRNVPGTGTIATDVAVLLVSHGKNGHGAWGGRGGPQVRVGQGSDNEDENDDGDRVFRHGLFTPDYDDMVIYRTKWQLDGVE